MKILKEYQGRDVRLTDERLHTFWNIRRWRIWKQR